MLVPSLRWYQIILLGDRGTCVQTTCLRSHSIAQRLGSNPPSPVASPTPQTLRHWATLEYCHHFTWVLYSRASLCVGCGLNFHKRCAYKIPNNCNYIRRKCTSPGNGELTPLSSVGEVVVRFLISPSILLLTYCRFHYRSIKIACNAVLQSMQCATALICMV